MKYQRNIVGVLNIFILAISIDLFYSVHIILNINTILVGIFLNFYFYYILYLCLFPSGWGTASFDGSISGSLQKSYLKVTPMSQCTDKYKADTADRDQLCTYLPKVNTCQVDSGGPLLWSDPATGRLNVIGVISNRFVCAEPTSTVQTRLATVNNLNWIKVILTGKYRQVSLKSDG